MSRYKVANTEPDQSVENATAEPADVAGTSGATRLAVDLAGDGADGPLIF